MSTNPEPELWATCAFCHRTLPLGEAINEGWVPAWWLGAGQHPDPACADCIVKHLDEDSDGELVLKPGHALPESE
jgi:hypothetical protein